MKRFAAAILAGVAMSLTLASVAEAKDKVIVINLSGRGDKDCQEAARLMGVK